jgi:hypothetical protein
MCPAADSSGRKSPDTHQIHHGVGSSRTEALLGSNVAVIHFVVAGTHIDEDEFAEMLRLDDQT